MEKKILELDFPVMDEGLYDLDVASEILSNFFILIDNKGYVEQNPDVKQALIKQRDLLLYESRALTGVDDNVRTSIIDKAFRLYEPILKKYHESLMT